MVAANKYINYIETSMTVFNVLNESYFPFRVNLPCS